MTKEMKSNLSQLFRQPESKLNIAQGKQNEKAPALKAFSLRASSSPFIVNNQFALKLDEII
jgi:hypothetical protein